MAHRHHRQRRPDLDERFKFDADPDDVFRVMLADDPSAPLHEDCENVDEDVTEARHA